MVNLLVIEIILFFSASAQATPNSTETNINKIREYAAFPVNSSRCLFEISVLVLNVHTVTYCDSHQFLQNF
jgi:hypothetical protein